MADKEGRAQQYLRKMSYRAREASNLESLTGESETPDVLSKDRAEEARHLAAERIEREKGAKLTSREEEELNEVFLKDGVAALERLQDDREDAKLTDDHVEALEAIVETDGSRPALEVSEDDQIDLEDDSLGMWKSLAEKYQSQISQVASAVGRIDLDGNHCGTGFVVKRGTVITNRHVLQELATEDSPGKWTFRGRPSITFNADPGATRSRQFELKQHVMLAGDQQIDGRNLDFNKLDFAVLECDVPHQAEFPLPLALESDSDRVATERTVYTIGFPAKPGLGHYRFSVLLRLFGNRFSIKRFAPGEIDLNMGQLSGDDHQTVFTHDATTLGGNSGSCVVDFGDDGLLVVGLHFAGMRKTENYAHSSAKLRESLSALDLSWNDGW